MRNRNTPIKRYVSTRRNTGIIRNKPVQRKTPVKKQSDKRKVDIVTYREKEALFLLKNPICQIQRPGCWHVSAQVHHTDGRGIHYLDESTWKAVCAGPCHDDITIRSKQAIKDGLSNSRTKKIDRTSKFK